MLLDMLYNTGLIIFSTFTKVYVVQKVKLLLSSETAHVREGRAVNKSRFWALIRKCKPEPGPSPNFI